MAFQKARVPAKPRVIIDEDDDQAASPKKRPRRRTSKPDYLQVGGGGGCWSIWDLVFLDGKYLTPSQAYREMEAILIPSPMPVRKSTVIDQASSLNSKVGGFTSPSLSCKADGWV